MKLLLTGAGGQVGRELKCLTWPSGYEIAAFDRTGLDITRCNEVFAAILRERPDIVINAAAYTAVDRAESEPETAWAGNCTGPANLAAACADAGIPLVHISTDYVFDGTKTDSYRADDPTPARRPDNSMLDCSRISAAFGIVPRPWRTALADVIHEIYEGAPPR